MTADGPKLTVDPAPDLDQSVLDEIRRESLAEAQARVDPRFDSAVIDIPAVAEWVAELIAKAVADRGPRCPIVCRGRSLILTGAVGRGKTHAAYGAIWALAASGVRCSWRVITMADAHGLLRPQAGLDTEEEIQKLFRVGLLVLDDVGAAKSSEWTEEILDRVIDYRYRNEKPTLITTNLIELVPKVGDRVASRLAEMCTQIALSGPDRRRPS